MSNKIATHGFGLYAGTDEIISVARELQTWLDEITQSGDIPQVSIALCDYSAGINVDSEALWDSENYSSLSFEYMKHLFIQKCKQFGKYMHLESNWKEPDE